MTEITEMPREEFERLREIITPASNGHALIHKWKKIFEETGGKLTPELCENLTKDHGIDFGPAVKAEGFFFTEKYQEMLYGEFLKEGYPRDVIKYDPTDLSDMD